MEMFPEKNVIQKSWAAIFFRPPKLGARSPSLPQFYTNRNNIRPTV